MDPKCQPSGCSKGEPQSRCNLDWVFAFEVGGDDYTLIKLGAIVEWITTRVCSQCSIFAEYGVNLCARVGRSERVVPTDDGSRGEHDKTDRDDG